MADAALDIVREFVRAQDSVTRKRGLRALGALKSSDASWMLVNAALDDSDPDVRKHAERVIAGLADRGAVDQALDKCMASRSRATYGLLGRLRLLGASCRISPAPWPTRLWRAMRLGDDLRRSGRWRFWVRGVAPAAMGCVVGLLLTLLALRVLGLAAADGREAEQAVGWALLLVLFAPLLAVWTTPTQMHFDRVAGTLADAMVAAIIPVALLVLLASILTGVAPTDIIVFVTLPLVVATIRIVVALVGGSVPVPVVGFLTTMLTAACAGIVVSALAIWMLARLVAANLNEVEPAWSFYWMLAFSLAWVFTWLDKLPAEHLQMRKPIEAPSLAVQSLRALAAARSNTRPQVAYTVFATVGVATLVMLWLAAPVDAIGLEAAMARGVPIEMKIAGDSQDRHAGRVPIEYVLNVGERGLLAVEVKRAGRDESAYTVEVLTGPSEQKRSAPLAEYWQAAVLHIDLQLDAVEPSATGSVTLDAGSYRLRVLLDEAADTAIARLYDRAARKLGVSSEREANLDLKVALEVRAPPGVEDAVK